MTKDELDKALAQRTQTEKEYRSLIAECEKERSEDSALIQAEKEQKELYSKYSAAHKVYQELEDEFNRNHEALLDSIYNARVACSEAHYRVNEITNKLAGVEND